MTASYEIRSNEDVPKALELFRTNYERLKEESGRERREELHRSTANRTLPMQLRKDIS